MKISTLGHDLAGLGRDLDQILDDAGLFLCQADQARGWPDLLAHID